jgi:pyruvate dehydrogenase E1 component
MPASDRKVWALPGRRRDGRARVAGRDHAGRREKLDNLVFVINCNLQRLDGPVRGNGKIIQELEGAFRGAGWNVIKVIWGGDWDPLLAKRQEGPAASADDGKCVDGEYQNYKARRRVHARALLRQVSRAQARWSPTCPTTRSGASSTAAATIRQGVRGLQASRRRQGPAHGDPRQDGQGLRHGRGGEGKNITHQQKKLNDDELREFRDRFNIPISDEELGRGAVLPPGDDSPEMKYLRSAAQALGGSLPRAAQAAQPLAGADRSTPSSECSRAPATRDLHDHGLRAHAGEAAARQGSASSSCRSSRRSAHLRHGGLFRQIGIYSPQASCTSRSTRTS